jgi:hypothetical protein
MDGEPCPTASQGHQLIAEHFERRLVGYPAILGKPGNP